MKMFAEASGTGRLTAGEAMHQLIGVPPEAIVHIRTDGDKGDEAHWSIRAEWDRKDVPRDIPETPLGRYTPHFETGEVMIGDAVREIRIPTSSNPGFAPRPATGPIDHVSQANDWSNPYKGQWGDH